MSQQIQPVGTDVMLMRFRNPTDSLADIKWSLSYVQTVIKAALTAVRSVASYTLPSETDQVCVKIKDPFYLGPKWIRLRKSKFKGSFINN